MPGSDDLVARLRHKSNMELIVTPADVALAERALASRDKEIERLTKERDSAASELDRIRAALHPEGAKDAEG